MRAILVVILSVMMASAVQASDWREPTRAEIAKMKAAAELTLKDSSSARYQGLKAAKSLDGSSIVICGLFNAKNSFGGYSGYQPFIYSSDSDSFMSGDPGSLIVIDAICNE